MNQGNIDKGLRLSGKGTSTKEVTNGNETVLTVVLCVVVLREGRGGAEVIETTGIAGPAGVAGADADVSVLGLVGVDGSLAKNELNRARSLSLS
jgi:hypothetical protein